VLIKQARKKSV